MAQTRHIKGRKKEQGQSLAEFALIMPILLLLTMGIIDFGRVLMTYTQQSAAVRNALRYGVIIGYAESSPGERPNYTNCNAMRDIAGSAFFANVISVQVDFLKTSGAIVPCNQNDSLLAQKLVNGDRLRIIVQSQVELITPFFPKTLPIVIQGQRTLVKEIALAQIDNPGGGGGGDDDDIGDDDDVPGEMGSLEESTTVALLLEGGGLHCSDARANRFIGLSWNAATDPDVEGFRIYAKPPSASDWTLVGEIPDPAATQCGESLGGCFTLAATNQTVMNLWQNNMTNLVYRVAAYGLGGTAEGASANVVASECVFRVYELDLSPPPAMSCASSNYKENYVGLIWDVTPNAQGYYVYAKQGATSTQVGQIIGGATNQCGYSLSGNTEVDGVMVPGCYNLNLAEWPNNKDVSYMVVPFTAGGTVYYFQEAVVLTPIFNCKNY